ncbi:MAG: RagB/SusD family nutrient uptake outer membrane protein, partial [Sediminibacterium sp.]
MNINKTLLLLVSVIVAGSLTSCSKQLEEVKPQEQISKQLALTDPNATQTLYAGIYSRLRAYNGTFFNLGEMRSDIWADGLFIESPDATSQQLFTHNISALNVPYGSWASFYNLIYNINNTIEVLKASPVTESIKTRELAEMYGIRAYVYYTMLKTWGGVPLTTEAVSTLTNAAATYKPRSTSDSVMLQVKSDIAKSLELFGTSNVIPTGNRVFWNRVATLTLKGDVFLWSGTNMGGGAADYTTAKTALQEIKSIESASLKLNAS